MTKENHINSSVSKNKVFAVGDIHGCHTELKELLSRLPLDSSSTIVFLGDYIDRGPDSKKVIETILNLKNSCNVISLLGNHEKMFLDFFYNNDTPEGAAFLYNGGTATLASYSDQFGNYNFPQSHIDFLNTLLPYYEINDFFFVHAGVPNMPLSEIKINPNLEELIWIRENFFESKFEWERLIIHGHTPVIEAFLSPKRINIDTGCIFEGKLTAIELPEKILYSVPLQKRTIIYPVQDEYAQRRNSIRFKVIIPVFIQVGNRKLKYQTINYSDYGMLLFSPSNKTTQIPEGETISGTIGKSPNEAHFKGVIIRFEKKNTGDFYAIKFTEAPINFLSNVDRGL